MLNCREVTERTSDYLDRALPLRTRLMLRLHIFMCQDCRRYVLQMRALVIALRGLTDEISKTDISRQVECLKRDV